jgi:hypothetical protein
VVSSLRVPEGWTRSGSGSNVKFSGAVAGRFAIIATSSAPKRPTIASLTKELRAAKGVTAPSGVTSTRAGRNAALTATYTQRSGKLKLLIRRYVFWRKGRRATINIGSPTKSAQVPDFVQRAQQIADSFRWL